ncbi:cytochrome c oxidase%2C Cbb3-type%2C CcoQ subunit [Campylobacter hyointestinalis]|uniref:CcoQ/FixQ family Cbb3-type cytochrome c oxidase assembly chaperone n=1 Tax=Campylobacter hyointestinalis subsp. hyointestinalis TaxID=91352 RepID=A0A2S5J802_CAMHY|nr:cytochrome c oxidase, cbb3-type, CcoQ subunit [Campylobacter hyointestinalis]ANE33040.1 cytochrome c oxidase CcoNOPQ, cbb3-type, subunit IV [Campylobacter hyointestinalis subsp. hyointestinalis LMG 9260]KEA43796.1 cytochrome C oxidase subunit III [Campylobacter hyointestinalis subsp. hyointestinalis]MBT0612073.1 cytochrome c oxidase, cbb3-type, CcoQ subunit [Campylobacter hyointestinalis subsp. hyointestinalis]MDL2346504.1 cytochrome c oxidase, cbb3-type, CcoQ subunit [Campylobacter hyointes
MSVETMRELQAYGYFILLVAMVVLLYGYWFHLKKSEKAGRRDYEQYSKLALNDDLSDEILENVSTDNDNAKRSVEK